MTPQEHKNAINAAMLRCMRDRDTENRGDAVGAHDAAVQALVRDYEIAITLGEYLAARLEKAASDLEKAQHIIEIRTAVNKVLESEVHELHAQMEAVGAAAWMGGGLREMRDDGLRRIEGGYGSRNTRAMAHEHSMPWPVLLAYFSERFDVRSR